MSRLAAGLLPGGRRLGTLPLAIGASAFLMVLAAAAALALGRAADAIDRATSAHATVQVVDEDPARRRATAARALARLRRLEGVTATAVAAADVARLVSPYVGETGADLLPLPALIDVTLAPGTTAARLVPALAGLRGVELAAEGATLAPLAALVATLRRLALAVLLVAFATATLVTALVARMTLQARASAIATLHALGATDPQIAALVQGRVARDATIGGIAGFAVATVVMLAVAHGLSGVDAALLAGARLGPGGWAVLLLLPALLVGAATLAARSAVLRALARVT